MSGAHTLYGSDISLFSGKARAYLRWKGIDFEEVPASMAVYKDIIVPRVGFPVVPIVVTPDDQTLQDTTVIIDHFEQSIGGPSVYPQGPRQKLAALLLEIYGDDWLVIPAMHYRWSYNKDWAIEQFGKNSLPNASRDEQIALGQKLSERFRGFCLPLGITEKSIAAIETSYTELLAELDAHFLMHPFLFGSRPSIGDYGLIGPLYAHLYRDPASRDTMERHGPNVARWVERLHEPSEPLAGEFFDHDVVPETLLPVLRRMMREQLPVLASTVLKLEHWFGENPNADIPRGIGFHEYVIGDMVENRVIMTYSQWLFQRAVDFYASLTGDERGAADELLDDTGGEGIRQIEIRNRVALRDFKLVRETVA